MLGYMYEYGISVTKNENEAFKMYCMGDARNDNACTCGLAFCYYNGTSIPTDTLKAIELFEKAAYNGSTVAAKQLGYMYKYGQGVKKNIRTATDWFERTAQHNDEESFGELILAYHNLEDYTPLFKIASKGYERKFMSSINTLAYCYAEGKGCPIDFKTAINIIDEAISLFPSEPNLYDSKGEILWLKGSKKEARKMWENVNMMSPNYYKENDTPLNQYITTSK